MMQATLLMISFMLSDFYNYCLLRGLMQRSSRKSILHTMAVQFSTLFPYTFKINFDIQLRNYKELLNVH